MSEVTGAPENAAAEFTPITSQEDLNRVLGDRLKRAKPADYDDLKAKASKFDELEAEKLTETQRLQSQLDAATATSTETQRENARLKVIADEGIPKKYHGLVHGSTPEALAESAAAVKELIGSSQERTGNKISYVNLDGDGSETLALNGDGIELALKNALGIS